MNMLLLIASLFLPKPHKENGLVKVISPALLEPLDDNLLGLVLMHFEVHGARIKKVIDLLIVDLKVADLDLEAAALVLIFLELVINIVEGVGQDAGVLRGAHHCVGLAGGGLPVHEDGAVVALQDRLHQVPAAALVHALGVALGAEHVVEGELVVVVGVSVPPLYYQPRDVRSGNRRVLLQ